MKNWIVILSCAGFVAAAFGMAFLGGANAAQKNAFAAEQARLVDAR